VYEVANRSYCRFDHTWIGITDHQYLQWRVNRDSSVSGGLFDDAIYFALHFLEEGRGCKIVVNQHYVASNAKRHVREIIYSSN